MTNFFKKKIEHFFDRQNVKLKKFSQQHHFDRQLVVGLFKKKKLSLKHIKYLPNFLTSGEKRQANILIIIIAGAGLLLAGNLFFLFTQSVARSGGEYSEGMVGSPRFINPILSQTNSIDSDLSRLIFSSLVAYDKNQELTPDLAESYDISEDQLVYTFKLKNNVKWHDGENFTANDVVFTVASIQDQEFKSPLGRKFRGVVCEKIDDYTVKFTLKEPFAPFISMLTFGILPEHLWYNIPPANADLNELNKKPVGTGPWAVDSFKKDASGIIKSYTLVPNNDYYGKKPYLSKLIFKFYGDNMSAIDALKNKNIDGISYLPRELRGELWKHNNIIYHELEQPQYSGVFFNQQKNTLLQSAYIRQALALAINKQKIITQVFGGDAKLLDAPILPGIDNNPDIVKYEFNAEGAASLLEKNGWMMTSTTTASGLTEQYRTKKGWDLKIVLTVADQPQYIAAANIIKEGWDQIGVKTVLEIVDKTKIVQDNINGRKYEALLFSENMSSDPDPFAFWHSSQNEYPGANLAIFTNKNVDALLESARKYNNIADRQSKYWEFQKIISSELPVIFLYSPTYTYPQDKAIKGFDVSGISSYSDRFANINEWYVKTKRIIK
ncbi:MAG: ABC transporter substrate-binding protein [Candidatus Buchananbacteria bacterium]